MTTQVSRAFWQHTVVDTWNRHKERKGPAPLLWRASDSETYADYGMSVCDSQSVLSSNSSDTLDTLGFGVLGDKLIE